MFDASSFDVDAYLSRIRYGGATEPTLETLRGITLAHPMALPFENLDPFLRRPVALDIESLQRKLVYGGRGGYCFEHNLLLGTALTALGFDVTGLAARVMWTVPPGVVTPRGHMLLLLHVNDRPYVVDAGFGGLTLTGPLRLEPDVEQETPHEAYRLTRDPSTPPGATAGLVMEARVGEEWRPLYRFDLQRQALVDYEVTNWYLSNHPRSHFVTGLIAARVDTDRRYALRNTEFAVHRQGSSTERRVLASPDELRRSLEEVFGILVPEGPDTDLALRRLTDAVLHI